MDSTRLSDLPGEGIGEPAFQHMQNPSIPSHPTIFPPNPEVIRREFPDDLSQGANGLGKTNYFPLNVHPNPLEAPSPPPSNQPSPQHQHHPPPNIIESSSQPIEYMPKEPQRIPIHDISIDPLSFTQDEQIQANYIPPAKNPLSKIKVNDYIKEYDETEGQKLYEHELEKAKQKWHEQLFQTMQSPILLFILLFIFQMYSVKRLMIFAIGRFTGTWIFREDGNMTVLGMILKSAIFTILYMILTWIMYII